MVMESGKRTEYVTPAVSRYGFRERHTEKLERRTTMATVKCALGKRGRPSHEWNDGKKDRIYCLGRVDRMTDDPLPECLDCPDFVNKAQDDLEAFYGRADNG